VYITTILKVPKDDLFLPPPLASISPSHSLDDDDDDDDDDDGSV